MPKQIDKTLATAEISRVNAAATLPKKKRQAKAPRIPLHAAMTDIVEHAANPGIIIVEHPDSDDLEKITMDAVKALSARFDKSGLFIVTSNKEEKHTPLRAALENEPGGSARYPYITKASFCEFLLAGLRHQDLTSLHLELANRVVLIKNCDMHNPYANVYLTKTLQWLSTYNVPVVISSYGLPLTTRRDLIASYVKDPMRGSATLAYSRDYPSITYSDGRAIKQVACLKPKINKSITVEHIDEESLTERLKDLLSSGGCVGITVNTVRKAQCLAGVLRTHFGDDMVTLIHPQYVSEVYTAKRGALQSLLKSDAQSRRPYKHIFVGTQILSEISGIDFDLVVSQACPADLLFERVNSLHLEHRIRSHKLRTPLLLVMEADMNGQDPVSPQEHYFTLRTMAALPNTLNLPMAAPDLIRATYDTDSTLRVTSSKFAEAEEKWDIYNRKKIQSAAAFAISDPWTELNKNATGWLDTPYPLIKRHVQAAVYGDCEWVDVILLYEKDNKFYSFAQNKNDFELDPQKEISDSAAEYLLSQRVRLPYPVCAPVVINDTISFLKDYSLRFSLWKENPILSNQLFLTFDEECYTELSGYGFIYDAYFGLVTYAIESNQAF